MKKDWFDYLRLKLQQQKYRLVIAKIEDFANLGNYNYLRPKIRNTKKKFQKALDYERLEILEQRDVEGIHGAITNLIDYSEKLYHGLKNAENLNIHFETQFKEFESFLAFHLRFPSNLQMPPCPNCAATQTSINQDGYIICKINKCTPQLYIPLEKPPKNPELSTDDSRNFNRLLLLCHHSLIKKDFDLAYQYAVDAMDIGFDTEEAWEYKALCYYLKTSKENLLQEGIQTIKADLQTAKNNIVTIASDTYDATVHYIAMCLNSAILKRYNTIQRGDESQRDSLLILMQNWQACFEIYPNVEFLKHLIIELVGLGKLKWLDLNNSSNVSNHSDNETNFNPLNAVTQLMSIFDEDDRIVLQEKLKTTLSYQLNADCLADYKGTLGNNYRNNSFFREHLIEQEDVDTIRECLQLWERAYTTFKNPAYLQFPVEELSNQKIPWLHLDDAGILINNPKYEHPNFMPINKLRYYVRNLNLNWPMKEKAIKTELAIAYNERAFKGFKKIINETLDKRTQMKLLEDSFVDWRRCYLATKNTDYYKNAIDIVFNEHHVDLFLHLDEGAKVSDVYPLVDFSAQVWLKKMCAVIDEPDYTYKKLMKGFSDLFVGRKVAAIKQRYDETILVLQNHPKTIGNAIYEINRCIRGLMQCFTALPQLEYLELCIDELNNKSGSDIQWIKKTKRGQMYNPFEQKYGIDSMKLRNEVIQLIKRQYPLYEPPNIEFLSKNERNRANFMNIFKKNKPKQLP